MSRWPRLSALAGYTAIALVYTYPLVRHWSDRCLGLIGDASLWLWNLWYFRYAATTLHSSPLWTDLQYWPYGANLLLHAYGLTYGILGFFLQPFLSLPAIFNLFVLSTMILGGFGIFVIAWEWGAGWGASFVAGCVFAFSPESHLLFTQGITLDHMSIQVLPLFLWTMLRVMRTRRPVDALLAALALTVTWGCDYYFFPVCAVLIAFFYLVAERPLAFEWGRRADGGALAALRRVLDALLVADALWLAWSLRSGQQEFHGRGSFRQLLAYVAPYLAFWLLAGLRVAATFWVRLKVDSRALAPSAIFPYAGTLGAWVLLNLPMIVAVLSFMRGGDYGGTPSPWRGGGNPTDVLWLLAPVPSHPLWGGLMARLAGVQADGWATAYLGFLPLAGVVWLWRNRWEDASLRLWFASAAFCAVLTLGPWLKVFGIHTYLPLPFYFLHLLPIFSNIQTGYRLSVFILLFLALLFAAFLKRAGEKAPPRWRPWVPALAFCWLAFEFAHTGIPLYDPSVPPLLERLGNRPDGALLPIPLGANFNGLGPVGYMGRPFMAMHFQSAYRKPIVGGNMARVARRTYENMLRDPFIQAIVASQDGGTIPAGLKDSRQVGQALAKARLRYVLVHTGDTPAALRSAIDRWPLRVIDEEGPLRLYAVNALE